MNKFLLLAFFLFPVCVWAQNLVPNPSFEDTVNCPTFPGQVWRAQGWYVAENTPDYFNACCNNAFPGEGVPSNDWGYRYAASGNAYCGFWCYSSTTLYREKMGIQLLTPLLKEMKYYVSFKLSSSSGYSIGANGACNKIGMLFSNIKYDLNNLPPTNNYSQFWEDSIITDTTGWVLVKGSFVADSSYDFLTIGNFFDNAHTDTLGYSHQPGNHNIVAYYYIDDICVTTNSTGCTFTNGINTPIYNIPFLIYPNPANDYINVEANPFTYNSILLYNSLGRVVYTNTETIRNKNYRVDVSDFPQGIYLLKLKNSEKEFSQKISIVH